MKTLHFTIDLRSFFLGALTLLGVLLLANFTPSPNNQPEQDKTENRRYQAVTGASGSFILDTQTGEYIQIYGVGKNSRTRFSFNDLQPQSK
ncbi:hypothetical protein [Spirosoma foliorum]|uniref:Uncharacterized protein n=1 Tax=Spirosoma foliorum TaxID=2710596 RepID=A0A7G5H2Q0_9BACT|nr:hypothetical protein [Spirosoma foliorum]QMW05392.1 hypothetical protein H3H32_11110 [Spirosoma foliorum]